MSPDFLRQDAFLVHRNGFLIFALLLILASPFLTGLSFTAQIILLGIFVLILGMPHGALDPLIAELYGMDMNTALKKTGFYLLYLVLTGLALSLWLIFPVISLIAFLLISIAHFAGDWNKDLPFWLRVIAATSLITNPCFFFPEEVNSIFSFLTFGADTELIVLFFQSLQMPVFILLFTGLGLHCFKTPVNFLVFLEVAALHVLASVFSPLVYFILYFCGLHSIRHYIETISELQQAGFKTSRIVLMIEIISVTTALLAAAIYFSTGDHDLEEGILRLVFIGLFALTVPHMFIIGLIKFRNK